MSWVVDASVALKWVIPEVLSDRAERLLGANEDLIAPDLLPIEAANALWKKTVRREISARDAEQALALLQESGLVLRPTGPLLAPALAIAHRLDHPVYDCVYVALARRERARLVTSDRRLARRIASRRLDVRVVELARV